MTFVTVPDKATGDVFTEVNWDTHIRDNLNKGVMRPIAESVLGAPAASISFNSIPADFVHLLLAIVARTTVAATGDSLTARFNGDTGANYDLQTLQGQAATPNSTEAFAQTVNSLFPIPGATAAANLFGGVLVFIPNYANTTRNKTSLAFGAHKIGTATGNLVSGMRTGYWRSNAAISSITLLPGTGPNFDTDTRATLYGMPN